MGKQNSQCIYTPELGEKIVKLVEQIGFVAIACEKVGIGRRTADHWRVLGENGDERYIEFATNLATAKAHFAAKQLKQVRDPKWILSKLERTIFGDLVPQTINANINKTLSREEAIKELKELLKTDPDILKILTSTDDK